MGVVNIQKTYGSGSGDVLKFLDGSMSSFICPRNIDNIYDYTFYRFSGLRYVEIGDNIKTIGDYAFYQCNTVEEWIISNRLQYVGAHAFASSAKSGVYIDVDFNNTTIKEYAFNASNLRNLTGYVNGVERLAFYDSSYYDYGYKISFTNLKIDGAVGANAFNGRLTGSGFFIDKESNITSLGEGSFAIMSYNQMVSTPHVLDFRGSTFTSLPTNAFSSNATSGNGLLNALIYLPTSLSSISNNVFYNHKTCYYYFSGITPPSLGTYSFSGINQWGGIFVPYNYIVAYKTATRWTSVSGYIKGWAPENTFSVGETLPTVNQEGYGLTWYTDRECTTQISVVVDADVELYCVASAGSVVDPVFANNDWSTIRQVVRMGIADRYWNVGDTKQITLTDSSVVTYRIVDMQAGRYALADGSGYSNMVLEPVYQFSNITASIYDPMSAGDFANSQIRNTTLANVYSLFPTNVKDAMSNVVVISGDGRDGGVISSSENKLFLASEMEMFDGRNVHSIAGIRECPLGQFDYYILNNRDNYRIKERDGIAEVYWLRSPSVGLQWCMVTNLGSINTYADSAKCGIAPVFAI